MLGSVPIPGTDPTPGSVPETNKNQNKLRSSHARMATAILTARRNQNLYRQPAKLVLGPTSATFVVVALISCLALLYLNQITKTGTLGYKLTDLTAQRDQILSQKQDLSVEAARLQSIQATKSSSVVAAMVPTTTVSYAK